MQSRYTLQGEARSPQGANLIASTSANVRPPFRHITKMLNLRRSCYKMNPTLPLEEESLAWYSPDDFYPVTVGEVLNSSYKVLGKLRYGAHSTVWLCRQIRAQTFVAVKVCTREGHQSARVHWELQFYERVSSIKTSHQGQSFIRGLLGTFEINGPAGQHLCLPILKWTISNVLCALAFLHEEAEVVHTDVNPSNIMLTVADDSVLRNVENAELENLLPKKIVDNNRTIYSSHKLGLPKDALWGEPVLCDFGEARIGRHHKCLSSGINVWSVAAMVWDLFENKHLFDAVDETGQPSATHHVAEMVAYLGLPPSGYINQSETTQRVFDVNGQWKGSGGVTVPPLSLNDRITAHDGENKRLFLEFINSMLEWLPEKRKTASDLLQHPWLNTTNS
ncbi:hypothetical protein OPT61_g4372 [Boeremia exigua]|uniref:Uncharacterized protein n=1 Tax=Boeremia exigua TaxID=749465 RepID=A0ACC2IEG1_9PLEO|nr:hypothetical protein OPT61_g4372 [Boeremia exigua]